MAAPRRPLRLLIAISPILFVCSTSASAPSCGPVNAEEEKLCIASREYEFCRLTLESDTRTPTADLAGLAGIAINLTNQNVSSTLGYIGSLIGKEEDRGGRNKLLDCDAWYADSLSAIQKAPGSLRDKLYDDVIRDASTVSVNALKCQNDFGDQSPLTDNNNEARKLANIVAVAASLLKSP